MMHADRTLAVTLLTGWLLAANTVDAEEVKRQTLVILDTQTGDYEVMAPQLKNGKQGSPRLSPDERYVAFDSWPLADKFNAARIYIQDLEHPEEPPVDIGGGAMPSWSRSGQEIAYSDPQLGGVWVMDSEGISRIQVAAAGAWHITFSPIDDDIVAYGRNGNDGPNIVIHNLATEESRTIVSPEVSRKYEQIVWNFRWSPDGGRIVSKVKRKGSRDTVLVMFGTDPENEEWFEVGDIRVPSLSCFHPETSHVCISMIPEGGKYRRMYTIDPDKEAAGIREWTEIPHQPANSSNYPGTWFQDARRMIIVREVPEVQ